MDDSNSGGAWIYIILTILVTVFGFFKKKLEKIMPEPEEVAPDEYQEDPYQEEEVYQELRHEAIVNKVADYTPKHPERTTSIPSSLNLKENPVEIEIPDLEDEPSFDLKKAVIYSEILHRKYD